MFSKSIKICKIELNFYLYLFPNKYKHYIIMNKAKVILNHIQSTSQFKSIYKLINPQLFDVTLRDGIQTMKPEDISYNKKIDMFQDIVKHMQPQKIEIGSFVSSKILPIMKDTEQLYQECSQILDNYNPLPELLSSSEMQPYSIPELYVLIPPTFERYNQACLNDVNNLSLITAVSEEFLIKNTNINENDTVRTISKINQISDKKIKLYISCINECPIQGILDNDIVINNILFYHNENFDNICLSDTCGTLSFKDYKYIIDECISFGVKPNNISLHLHINKNIKETVNIIRYSLNKKINKFDVSAIENGGCSVTMDKNRMHHNLTYDVFYDILLNYIVDLTNEPNEPPPYGQGVISLQSVLDTSFNSYSDDNNKLLFA